MAIFTLLSGSLGGCISTRPTAQSWPESAPPITHYEEIYAQDEANQQIQSEEEYLTWIVRFYEGWKLSRRGWERITNSVLDAVDTEAERQYVSETMAELGRKISGEWAKDSKDRLISTATVITWGTALQNSVATGQTIELIERVVDDVNALFEGTLARSDITFERYIPEEEVNEFF